MPLITMKRYTLQQRMEIVKIHYKNGKNFTERVRKVESFLGRRTLVQNRKKLAKSL